MIKDIDELTQLHYEITKSCVDIMYKKNHDYTNGSKDPFANFRMSELVGVNPQKAILVRVLDKIKRLETSVDIGLKVPNESNLDSVRDIINYMVLFYGLSLEVEKGNE